MPSLLPSLWNTGESLLPLSRMHRAIDQLFEDTLGGSLPTPVREGKGNGNGNGLAFLPAVDVKETEDAVIVETEVPGMTSKDVTVQVEGDLLTIKGERKHEEEKRTKTWYRKECSYGSFERQIPLPVIVLADKAEAAVVNGVLKVTLPKEPGSKAKSVSLRVK